MRVRREAGVKDPPIWRYSFRGGIFPSMTKRREAVPEQYALPSGPYADSIESC